MDKLIGELDGLDAIALTKLISVADEIRTRKLTEARKALLAEMREKASALQITLEDLVHPGASARTSKTEPGRRPKIAPQYRSPNGEEWSGRGKPPRWLAALEAEGRSRDHYRVGSVAQKSPDLLSNAAA